MTSKPTEIKVTPYQLTITWSDSHESTYPMKLLRGECRCANCVNELTGEPILDKSTIKDSIRCLKAEPTGHYGMTLKFSDNHGTGIYTYTHLREICPCKICCPE